VGGGGVGRPPQGQAQQGKPGGRSTLSVSKRGGVVRAAAEDQPRGAPAPGTHRALWGRRARVPRFVLVPILYEMRRLLSLFVQVQILQE